MARELIFFIVLLLVAIVGGYLLFGTEEEVAEAESFIEDATEVVSAELEGREPDLEPEPAPEPTTPLKPMEEFLPKELPEGISLVSLSDAQGSDGVYALIAGYSGSFDIALFNCSDEETAEQFRLDWQDPYVMDRDPISVFINGMPADQMLDEALGPKAYAWRDGNFVFTIVRYQPDPDGNLLRLAKGIGRS